MKDLVELLVRSLVTAPEAVQVTASETNDTVHVEVRVAADDMGKIIGKQGKVARAIRTLAKAAAARSGNKRVNVEFR